jgi:hypothetical protein
MPLASLDNPLWVSWENPKCRIRIDRIPANECRTPSWDDLERLWPEGWKYPHPDKSSWQELRDEWLSWNSERQEEWLKGRLGLAELQPGSPLLVSHSHSSDEFLFAAVTEAQVVAIGVDFELKSRQLPQRIAQNLQALYPKSHSPTCTWVAIEACFKALRDQNHPAELQLSFENEFGGSVLKPLGRRVKFQIIPDELRWIAVAVEF